MDGFSLSDAMYPAGSNSAPQGQPTWPLLPGQPGQPGQPNASGGQFPGSSGGQGWPYQPGGSFPGQTPPSAPVQSGPLPVPYNMPIPHGLVNKTMLTFVGEVKLNAQRFVIDIKRGNDIVFHFNPRFKDEGRRALVRNSMIGDKWGKEERDIPNFPFAEGQRFEIKIMCTEDSFRVAVNKSHLFEYKYRFRQINEINNLSVQGDITLLSADVSMLP
ncbi:galectin-3b [Erpetoichthys calabaricus]|uniref:Galectin n=1 Tax=Erpetoichthys calabaricus TaxID=27687 RepID=A0A8C4TEV4_ERPCA|nr:galectin-3b [Erpetoichthys calabaricus]